MNKEEFLKEKDLLLNSIENNTKEHWENYYKGVPIECIYDDLVIDINEIKRLTEENQKLKEVIDKVIEYIKSKKCKYDGWEITTQLYEDEIRQLEDILKEVE